MSRWWCKPRNDRIDPPAQPGTTAVVLFGPDGSEIDRISGFLSRRQLERLLAAALDQARP